MMIMMIYMAIITIIISLLESISSPHHFLAGAQHAHLAKAHVEGRAAQGAVGLAHHDDVDAPGQGGRVQPPVQLLHLHEHLPGQLPHVVHGLTCLVQRNKTTRTTSTTRCDVLRRAIRRHAHSATVQKVKDEIDCSHAHRTNGKELMKDSRTNVESL